MKQTKAVSYIDEKYSAEIQEVLSTHFAYTSIEQLEFVKVEEIIETKKFTHLKAFRTTKTLYNVGFSIFIVGVARPFDIMTAKAVIKAKGKCDDIILIIAATQQDFETYRREISSAFGKSDKLIFFKCE